MVAEKKLQIENMMLGPLLLLANTGTDSSNTGMASDMDGMFLIGLIVLPSSKESTLTRSLEQQQRLVGLFGRAILSTCMEIN